MDPIFLKEYFCEISSGILREKSLSNYQRFLGGKYFAYYRERFGKDGIVGVLRKNKNGKNLKNEENEGEDNGENLTAENKAGGNSFD